MSKQNRFLLMYRSYWVKQPTVVCLEFLRHLCSVFNVLTVYTAACEMMVMGNAGFIRFL